MAYYFMIRDKVGYKSINLNNHPCFEKKSKFKDFRFSLEEIDNFTSIYANELALRESLWYNGLLDDEELFREISIRFKVKEELKKVKYGPIYQESFKYLNPVFLNYKLKSLCADKNFQDKFLSYYRGCSINKDIIYAIRACFYGDPELDIYKLIDEFMNREIYNRKYNLDTRSYDYLSIRYKSLHDLAMFVYNYETKPEMSKYEIDEELKDFICYFKNETESSKPLVIKKSKVLEGQTSFFD